MLAASHGPLGGSWVIGARSVIGALITRDVRRAIGGAAWLPVGFFLVVATLVPFAVGPDPRLLERIAAGGLWIAALTAALLPIERLIEPDRANGMLDQLALRGLSEESRRRRENRRALADLRAAAAASRRCRAPSFWVSRLPPGADAGGACDRHAGAWPRSR